MVVDYEAAWHALGEYVAGRTQHGREGLLVEMQRIASEARVPAGELSRLLRLYAVEVEQTRLVSEEDGVADFPPGRGSVGDDDASPHHRTEEVHDGSRSTAEPAGVG